MARFDDIYARALRREPLGEEELLTIYTEAPVAELAAIADTLRRESVPDPDVVTWQIDRNVNTTNVCISGCKFCNFHCKPHQRELAYITGIEEYRRKTEEMLALGGDQLLLQGGLHPKLGIDYYENLFRELKAMFPQLKLNALGAPEVWHIAKISGITIEQTLERLVAAGLDSLPGAGAEILDEEIRRRISPAKPTAEQWITVMRAAHRMGLPTTATMMYGHIETPRHRIRHLIALRELQAERPAGSPGFTAFIPWVFSSAGTELEREGVHPHFSPLEYIRTIAVSRIALTNIANIQASWLTVGKEVAQIALHSGANDMGSIMIEENVVSSAGARNRFDATGIQSAIREAGFTPRMRDQQYNYR
jgi:cyclic dehypoxanthinyl futalosine synthase